MLILSESEIRGLVDARTARAAIEGAFRALHRGEATLANVISLPFRRPEGVAHIKAGHLHDDGVWTVKVSTDFDPGDGGAVRHSGLMLVISAIDGTLVGVLGDNGFLTELRTGAAGAVAVDDRRQAASFGELHHAIEAGMRTEEDVVTLGELLEGVAPGRVGDEEITVADLTGVGVQDAAIAALVVREASRAQVAELASRGARDASTARDRE